MKRGHEKKDGISLRKIHIWLIIGMAIISGLLFYYTYHLSVSFQSLTKTSELQIELRKAARELMDASDYLTEKVQRFTVKGERKFLDDYFNEAFKTNRREEALAKMSNDSESTEAVEKLQNAMNGSLQLMEREYYAMRLVIEAKGYTDYPEVLEFVNLSDEDMALSPDEKMRLATEMVLDNEYYRQKDIIRENMKGCLDELEKSAYDTDASAMESLQSEMTFLRIIIALQIVVVFFMVWLTSLLGIRPILNAVKCIREDRPVPETGAKEFTYLARTYNNMYEVSKTSLERLNFMASHDELTGVYNRAGYDLILSNLDKDTTYMMLFDLDNFKTINDGYGHEMGDKVLIKAARVLKNNFRAEDYVCRLGGDEFVVFMVHAKEKQDELLVAKINRINNELMDTGDGLPFTSVSVGIAYGADAKDIDQLFEMADVAMYQSKQKGRHTYSFHGDSR